MRRKQAEVAIAIVVIIVVAVVFHQIATSMADQGIATGGPYDNAAAYPRVIAIGMGVILIATFVFPDRKKVTDAVGSASVTRPVLLVLTIVVYLFVFDNLGYHLTTPPMIATVMSLCGERKIKKLMGLSIFISLLTALVFEVFLDVVLPAGVLNLVIPW